MGTVPALVMWNYIRIKDKGKVHGVGVGYSESSL